MAGLQITELQQGLSFGSRVKGVTWDNIADDELRQRLRQLFIERGVIVFEDMEPSPKMQVALSTIFGPLKDHPTRNVPRADGDMLGVIDMHSLPREDPGHDHGLTVFNGKKVYSFLPWHFDHSYNDELNYAGVLRAVVAAPEEGRTGFADGIDIYKRMDPKILAKIEKLSALYTLDVRLTQMKFGRYFETFGDTERERANTEESSIFPRSIHPMVWQRPTGEKVAHFCGFSAVGIEGHEDAEGEAIFEEALQEMYRADPALLARVETDRHADLGQPPRAARGRGLRSEVRAAHAPHDDQGRLRARPVRGRQEDRRSQARSGAAGAAGLRGQGNLPYQRIDHPELVSGPISRPIQRAQSWRKPHVWRFTIKPRACGTMGAETSSA